MFRSLSSTIALRAPALLTSLAVAALPFAGGGCALLEALAEAEANPPAAPVVEPPPPPVVSGGTLFVTPDGAVAVAADSAADRVFVIDTVGHAVLREIPLNDGAEPGRVVGGPAGTVLVALRGAGEVMGLDLATGTVWSRDVCPSPRGVAYDAFAGVVHVACSGGELVTLAADLQGAPLRSLRLDRDLRDVLVMGDKLVVSRFRSAEVLVLDANGAVEAAYSPTPYTSPSGRTFEPAVGYRLASAPFSPTAVFLVHQRAFSGVIPTGPSATGTSYYAGPCDNTVVHAAVASIDVALGANLTMYGKGGIGTVVMPVDAAVAMDGRVAVVGAGSNNIVVTTAADAATNDEIDRCSGGAATGTAPLTIPIADPIAVAFSLDGRLFVQAQGQLLTELDATGVVLANVYRPTPLQPHTGHSLFHHQAGPFSPIACASCHPEGGDDGRVWRFEALGDLRTQTMRGGVLETLPLHWEGDMETFDDLLQEVMVNRMAGTMPNEHGIGALADWVNSVPDLPASAPVDAESASRGAALFHDPAVGCATCHNGPRLTNNANIDVGTGRSLQVPSLVGVADRLPVMHTGCGETLFDRFDPTCGGGDKHGTTSQLTDAEIADLVAYLETL